MARILVIDDDADMRLTLRGMLENHALLEAADGKEALRLLASEQVDLVITDLVMPEKEGLETIVELRRDHPTLKIIAISGAAIEFRGCSLRIAQQLGAQVCLAKPFTPAELSSAIRQVLGS